MRKVNHPEGAEFSHEDLAAWEELTVMRGQIVEVLLTETGEDFPPDLWGGFLVVKVELGLEGDMILHAKSLGCDDHECTRWLSTNFNRRAGCLHLCHSYPCEVDGDFTLHVTRLRLFSPEGFARDCMTSAVKKQMKKWLDQMEDDATRPPQGLNITVPLQEGDLWEEVEPMKTSAKAPPSTPSDRLDEKISLAKREELRKRLDDAKARMNQSLGGGAGPDAVRPPERSEVPGSPGYSPSPVEEAAALESRRQGALRVPPRRSALENVEPLELEDGEEKERERRERKKKKSRAAEKANALAIKDTSTGSLQTQLLNQAAKATQEKTGRLRGEREKAKKKDPGSMLVKWLQLATGSGKKKKKKKKRDKRSQNADPYKGSSPGGQKRRRKKEPGRPGSSPSSSSGSGQMSGSDLSSNEALDETSSSSEDLRMEPPLRKKARERPGSVLQLLVEHARAQLDQSAKGGGREGRGQELHLRGQAELLLPDHHTAPGWHPECPGPRDAPPELVHGCSEGRCAGPCGGPVGGTLHQSPPVPIGWELDSGETIGVAAAGRDFGSWASVGPASQETGQACGKGDTAGTVVHPGRRQRPWRPGKGIRLVRLVPRKQGKIQERRQRKRQGKRLVGSEQRGFRARPQQQEGEAGREVEEGLPMEGRPSRACEEPETTSAFDGAGIKDFKSSIPSCTSYRRLGCILAWWLIHSVVADDLIFQSPQWMKSWKGVSAAANLSAARGRNSVFPFREGELITFVSRFKEFSLEHVTSPEVVEEWSSCAWLYNVVSALNKLAGYKGTPYAGRWTSSELAAVSSMRRAIERRCARDAEHGTFTEAEWRKELSGRMVGYSGEEISTCQQLSWEQVIPSLPPEEHGGSIETLHWVSPRTREFLLNPGLLLKDHADVKLPRLPGKIHVKAEDKMAIAHELVRRNICTWVPLETVYQVGSQQILNGLFGVKKPSVLKSGEPVLRLIMNLTGSNATQHQLEGGASNLPAITSWQSLVLEQGEQLEMFQSDMSSAFYLFKVPSCWHRHLAFNVIVSEEELLGHGRRQFALCCSVLPMGWLNSVSIMQEVSENILRQGRLNPYNQVARADPLPKWFSEVLDAAEEADRSWWHVYLDNFCACERIEAESSSQAGALCHEAAERAWKLAGVISSEKKRISAANYIQELGAEVDGCLGLLGIPTPKLHKLAIATLWTLVAPGMEKKKAQIIAGRWIFVLQFRRPAMGFLQDLWRVTSGNQKITKELINLAKGELLGVLLCSPLIHCNLGASVAKQIVCTDASERAGAVGFAESLSEEGEDFVKATAKLQRPGDGLPIPVLLVSLFNGIGGAFRAYDTLSAVAGSNRADSSGDRCWRQPDLCSPVARHSLCG